MKENAEARTKDIALFIGLKCQQSFSLEDSGNVWDRLYPAFGDGDDVEKTMNIAAAAMDAAR